jgi:hypothetical protein
MKTWKLIQKVTTDQWVDLDAEDADDPLMVSKYIFDSFRCMRYSFHQLLCPLLMWHTAHNDAKPTIHG